MMMEEKTKKKKKKKKEKEKKTKVIPSTTEVSSYLTGILLIYLQKKHFFN